MNTSLRWRSTKYQDSRFTRSNALSARSAGNCWGSQIQTNAHHHRREWQARGYGYGVSAMEIPRMRKRYAAKLLFRYVVVGERRPRGGVWLEERVVQVPAVSARAALVQAQQAGRKAMYRFEN